MTRGAAVVGCGSVLPPTVVTSRDLERRLDTREGWIVERSGIRERHIGGTTTELAAQAARGALSSAGWREADVDMVIVATSTADQTMPATSAAVQEKLGLACGGFDVDAACAGYVYALISAYGLIALGHERVLVVGADVYSRITDPLDRSTSVLFADGAAALAIEATADDAQLLAWDTGADGSGHPLLQCDHGSCIAMEGRQVFRRAVRCTVESANAAMERAKVTADDVALFVPHQANLRIIQSASERLGIPMDRTAIVVETTGNTSAASVPLALTAAIESNRVSSGDLVLLSAFGAGMTWASAVIRW